MTWCVTMGRNNIKVTQETLTVIDEFVRFD
jgi:hypothetical protein